MHVVMLCVAVNGRPVSREIWLLNARRESAWKLNIFEIGGRVCVSTCTRNFFLVRLMGSFILKIRSRSCNFIFVKLNTNIINLNDTYENFCPKLLSKRPFLYFIPDHRVNILEEEEKKEEIIDDTSFGRIKNRIMIVKRVK